MALPNKTTSSTKSAITESKPAAQKPAAPKPTPKADPKPAAKKSEAPKFLVKLTGCQQIQDPGTKVTLFQNQMVPVPLISNWVRFQETVGYLEIIEL